MKVICPVCEKFIFTYFDEVCPVCKWQHDEYQECNYNYQSGPNHGYSLYQYRARYRKEGRFDV